VRVRDAGSARRRGSRAPTRRVSTRAVCHTAGDSTRGTDIAVGRKQGRPARWRSRTEGATRHTRRRARRVCLAGHPLRCPLDDEAAHTEPSLPVSGAYGVRFGCRRVVLADGAIQRDAGRGQRRGSHGRRPIPTGAAHGRGGGADPASRDTPPGGHQVRAHGWLCVLKLAIGPFCR